MASWFETPRRARLLTMRLWHVIGEEVLIQRSIAKRCVSKDEANEVEPTAFSGSLESLSLVRGLMVRDARRRAPHHEGSTSTSSGEEDLVLRSIAKRCVSKDEAMEIEIALVNDRGTWRAASSVKAEPPAVTRRGLCWLRSDELDYQLRWARSPRTHVSWSASV